LSLKTFRDRRQLPRDRHCRPRRGRCNKSRPTSVDPSALPIWTTHGPIAATVRQAATAISATFVVLDRSRATCCFSHTPSFLLRDANIEIGTKTCLSLNPAINSHCSCITARKGLYLLRETRVLHSEAIS
jgi:hypothetical protein